MVVADLSHLTDAELAAEIQARKNKAQAKAEEQRRIRNELIVKNIGALLELTAHNCTSCSDAKPCNAIRSRCSRCALLEIQREGFVYDTFNLEIKTPCHENNIATEQDLPKAYR